jgi:hypothetical protein
MRAYRFAPEPDATDAIWQLMLRLQPDHNKLRELCNALITTEPDEYED